MDGPGGWRARPSRSVMTKMMKESVKTGHPTGLPDKLLRLFAVGPPLKLIKENFKVKKPPAVPWQGLGGLVGEFASPGDPEYEPKPAADFPEPRLFGNKEFALQVRLEEETKMEKEKRLREWKQDKAKQDLEEKIAKFDPNNDPMVEGDPYKTLFVSRLSYEVTERKLRHEFEEYGPIKRIRLVHDQDKDKPRGYAFIEYEHKKDMKEAYKQSDGRKIEGRRILVDVERGRTVENWRPMRLAGGLGGDSRLPKESRKKILQEAAARGVAAPSADDRGPRRDEPRGPPRDYDRGPPPDRYGGGPPGRGPPMDRYGGGGPRGPPRDYGDRGGGDRGDRMDRDRPPPRDYDRGGDRGDRYRDRGGDRGDRDKRSRDMSPSSRDYKRSRYDEDRDRGRSRHDRDY